MAPGARLLTSGTVFFKFDFMLEWVHLCSMRVINSTYIKCISKPLTCRQGTHPTIPVGQALSNPILTFTGTILHLGTVTL